MTTSFLYLQELWMSGMQRLRIIAAGCATALALFACGGDGKSNSTTGSSNGGGASQDAGAPALTTNIALDGRNWMNYRRSQAGMPQLVDNPVIDIAAQGHSEYQRINNTVSHDQTPGTPGFTGATLLERLMAAGYVFTNASHAYGEVISATTSKSGFFMAEELITAIYHRFVIFEPVFKEIGTGSATTSAGYTYFTADFTANNGYGPGVGSGNIATWPYSSQAQVATNFFSDQESPDPVAGINEVGYPISVHANINVPLSVQSFTVSPRGGANLNVKLLAHDGDAETPRSAAAIVPLSVLASRTTYDVSFVGAVDGVPVTRNWSFTTK
jgi:uncharacterized protein YkwD